MRTPSDRPKLSPSFRRLYNAQELPLFFLLINGSTLLIFPAQPVDLRDPKTVVVFTNSFIPKTLCRFW